MKDSTEFTLHGDLLEEFDCYFKKGSDPKATRKRLDRKRTAEKTFYAFQRIRQKAGNKEEAIRLVRNEMLVGLNPVVAWFTWLLIRTLVEAIVAWLWKRTEGAS